MAKSVFNQPHYVALSSKETPWLSRLIEQIKQTGMTLTNAIDVGCGPGHFSRVLHEAGINVLGVDGRASNVEAARIANPQIPFHEANVEDDVILTLGTFDLVLCLGLLYHLENTFLAIRNLCRITNGVLIGESRIAPSRKAILMLYEEGTTEDQGLNYIALVPSEACLVKMLYTAGFEFVYLSKRLPLHPDFGGHFSTVRVRTCFVASRLPLHVPDLIQAPNVTYHSNLWHRWWVRLVAPKARRLL